MTVRRNVVGIVAAAALALAAVPVLADDAPCHLNRITQLDMSIDQSGRINVPMQVGGQSFNMLIDTGGVQSMLTQSSVEALGLHPEIFTNVKVRGFGGRVVDRFVTAHDISFGGLKAPRMPFLVMADGRLSPNLQGILGPDILRAYDDDFDFANAKFGLFERQRCDGNLVYWTDDDHAEIPFDIDQVGHIRFNVMLDGKKVRVLLDTGASGSVMNLEAAESLFGFEENDPLLRPLHETANGHTYKYPFKTMTFGGVTVSNPDVVLMSRADEGLAGLPEMLLGIGILRQLHMYISYRQEKLFVTAASAH